MPDPNTFVQTILLSYMSEHGVDPLSEEGKLFFTSLGLLQTPSTYTATITLSAAQIKNWVASPVQIVAAPGASKMIVIAGGMIQYLFGTAMYVDSGSSGSHFFYQGASASTESPANLASTLYNTLSGAAVNTVMGIGPFTSSPRSDRS